MPTSNLKIAWKMIFSFHFNEKAKQNQETLVDLSLLIKPRKVQDMLQFKSMYNTEVQAPKIAQEPFLEGLNKKQTKGIDWALER